MLQLSYIRASEKDLVLLHLQCNSGAEAQLGWLNV